MKHRLEQWAASLRERQIATSIALVCLLLIIIVSIWPDIFHSSGELSPVRQAAEPPATPVTAVATRAAQPPEPAITPAESQPAAPAKPEAAPAMPKKAPVATKPPAPDIPQDAPPATNSTPPLSSGYYIQVGAFSDKKRASAMQQKIQHAGWPVHIMPKAKGLLGVVIGPYPSRKQAEQQQKKILQQLKLKGYPIQHTS